MLASLLANISLDRRRGGDDVWLKRNRRSRREEMQRIRHEERERQKEYLLKRENEKKLTEELRFAYQKLTGTEKTAQAIAALVEPFTKQVGTKAPEVDFAWISKELIIAKNILTLYYDILDEDLLLILASAETP